MPALSDVVAWPMPGSGGLQAWDEQPGALGSPLPLCCTMYGPDGLCRASV